MANNSKDTKIVDKYIAKYNAALNIHNNECQIQWNRFNALLVVNTIFVGLIGLTYNSDFTFPTLLNFLLKLLPLAGLLICYWWWKVTMKGFYWIHKWIDEARKIEAKIKTGDLNPITNGEVYSKEREPGLTQTATKWIIVIIAIIYGLIFITSLFSAYTDTLKSENYILRLY